MPSPKQMLSTPMSKTAAVLLSGGLTLGLLLPAIAYPQTRIQQMLEQQAVDEPEVIRRPNSKAPAPARPPVRVNPTVSPNRTLPGNFQLRYIWPTKGVVTSGFGWRWGRMHQGIDIGAPTGTPVFAAAPGTVVSSSGTSGGYGNLVKIQHPDGSITLYAHNSRLLVKKGQQVDQGQPIALVGSTGNSTGPHLHFEVRPAGKAATNPLAYLPR